MHDLENKIRGMVWNILFPICEGEINREILIRRTNRRTYVELRRCGQVSSSNIPSAIEVIVRKETKYVETIKPWDEKQTISIDGMQFGVYHEGCKNFELVVYGVTQTVRRMLFKHSKEDAAEDMRCD